MLHGFAAHSERQLERKHLNTDKIVMVLDDEPGVAQYCQVALERAGYGVIVINDAPQAIGVLQKADVDLLLVDIRMPEMDGFQVMELARKHQPDIGILIMTGYGTLETATKALRLGANGLIFKPFASTQELLDDVARALDDRKNARETSRLQALRPLLKNTESLFSKTEEDEVVKVILDSIQSLLNCSHAGFYQREEQENGSIMLRLIKRRGNPLPGEPIGFTGGPVSRADAWGALSRVNPDSLEEPELLAVVRENGLGAVLCMPALRGSGVNSVILAGRDQNELPFTDADVELFSILAKQAAVALENAQLYANLRATLVQIQSQQQALLQSEKMAAIGRLTASIAHEVNNPLQAVRNCLHLVNRTDLNQEKRDEYLQLAQDEMKRLMDTVKQMLDFYRPSALQKELVDVNALIQTVLSLLMKEFQNQNISLETKLQKGLPLIYLVRNQIQQVIFNLLINAMEAMPDGGKIMITTCQSEEKLKILISDSGPGVPEDTRMQLFEPFISSKPQGTGLGLSVSYSIIDTHGGLIELVDETQCIPGYGGACFKITLPLLEVL